jgi:hypothetical protein
MLTQSEIADRWLTGNLSPGTTMQAKDDAESRGSLKDPPAPLSVAILDCRDLLRDRLACWADDFAEHTGTKGPLRHGVIEDSAFLLRWLSNVEWVEWIGDWFEELAETMSDAHSLAPWRPAFTRLPAIPCPECHMYTLGLFGGEEDVSCTNPKCRAMFSSARYGIWEREITERRATA